MKPYSSVGVLIHGYHLQASGWEDVVWGDPHQQVGRVPKAIAQALHRRAGLVWWGSGASSKDGKVESEYTFDFALQHLDDFAEGRDESPEEIAEYLKEVSILDRNSQNTEGEIRNAIYDCERLGIRELYLVSSPTHISRCMLEACKVLEKTPSNVLIYGCASDTSYGGSKPDDVVIFEPPHRGDRPKNDLYKHIRATRRVPAERMPEFLPELDALVVKYTS